MKKEELVEIAPEAVAPAIALVPGSLEQKKAFLAWLIKMANPSEATEKLITRTKREIDELEKAKV